MKYLAPAVLLSCCCTLATAADCTEQADNLTANYQVTRQSADGSQQSYSMTLWRQGEQVAHQYPERGITQVWGQAANGSLHLGQHFDEYQKGIEYQPLDINRGRGEKDWSLRYQLVSDQLKARMERVDEKGNGCEATRQYRLDDERQLTLSWREGPRLLESFEIRSQAGTTTWTLTSVDTDQTRVAQFFDRHANYQLTDYADIGDNESDPFIRQMIHLGFIDHGASGFYDAQGNAAEHHH
ncbi:hypothetical protein GCM10011348_11860 [Marinobacterium nitratireducens]|uniref:Uncharacterized protein n=1 Tax=Marinobacterium nitratireducens TaxID=518897 RepID=A0A918DPP6_9GAMM|nr:hypothetical protein [Marinobacterium nitratireducens]GGO78900.1 hypothetical protein GCM10011348_11860 [Marinobacterium nitratireducens]